MRRGSLKAIDLSNGKAHVELLLAQDLADGQSSARASGGSAKYEFRAGPDEVVAFQVPRVGDDAGRVGERLSFRIQMRSYRY